MTIKDAITNLNFDARLRAESSLAALNYVDLMIADFKIRESKTKADILLDVFGLLQGLFVGIDSLYQLSISTTKYKYHININQNKILRDLKFVRNDVVGHPTNRSYQDGSYGFSFILDNEITKHKLAYMTYIIKDNEISKKKVDVNFNKVISAYEKEKHQVITDIENFLLRKPAKLDISGFIVNMYQKALQNDFNLDDIETLKTLVRKDQNFKQGSTNRMFWHIKLLKKTFLWKDETYQGLINYLRLNEMLKIYKMYLDLNDKKIKMPILDKPLLINKIHQLIKENTDLRELTPCFTQIDHPHFEFHIDKFIDLVDDIAVKAFIKWFKLISDNDQSYLIGKTLQDK